MRSLPTLFVCLAVLFGCTLDVVIKHEAMDLDVVTITTWRFVFGSVPAIIVFLAVGEALPPWKVVRFHLLRGAVQVCMALLFFYALSQIALAEATVLGFTAALFVPIAARLILGERTSLLVWLAAGAGFGGAVLAISRMTGGAPMGGMRTLGMLACLVAAVGYALTLVLLRLRAQKDSTALLSLLGNVIPALFLLGIVGGRILIAEEPPTFLSDPRHMVPLALLGALGFSLWWLMALAYRDRAASRLAPFQYLALPFNAGFGFLLFGETPGWQLFAGGGIIIAACVLVTMSPNSEAGDQA